MTKRGLTTYRLDDLLPAMECDPAVEAHAQHLLATKREYFERLSAFIYPTASTWDRSVTLANFCYGEVSPSFYEAADRSEELILLSFALQASKVSLLKVVYYANRELMIALGPGLRSTPPQGWVCFAPGLIDLLGFHLNSGLIQWSHIEAESARAFLDSFLARLEEIATSRTAAGILALVGAFLLKVSLSLSTFDRQVERLTRRVLAAGGQTALFAPLN